MKPIIFSAPMVRAILDGSKKQTRRVVKPQPTPIPPDVWKDRNGGSDHWWPSNKAECMVEIRDMGGLCPYGVPGDLLYVKEQFSHWADAPTKAALRATDACLYRADYRDDASVLDIGGCKWRPSIHMPRWASRITLRVVSVRVERLGEISESDMLAEGSPFTGSETSSAFGVDQRWFPALWDSRNKKHPWSSNPHVWVLDFERVEGGAA